MRKPKQQSGFTLIEIAIVLVIIGLLLGGVLKGQELINSAKVKNFAQDFKTVPLYIYGYQDKYRALPGDDKVAATHLASAIASASVTLLAPTGTTLGDGALNGNYNSEAATDETLAFWQQVRLAGLAAGPTDFGDATKISASVPKNADGGRIGIQSNGSVTPGAPIAGMTGSYFVCSDGIQGKFVLQLDTTMDDGNPATGSMRAIPSAPAYAGTAIAPVTLPGGANPIVDGSTYTVCLAL
ncbi:MAG: prepilin-type N-terminal cleavage/methylation domain-containing protein [Sterolibacterium sp.]|nr:prepilin-type N-terminal cleavage/methylation domain-containing protein [Sterolibacterium sp.]